MASQRGREIPCGNFSFALAEAWQYTINSLLFFEARKLKNSEMRFSNSKIKWVSLCFCLLLSLQIIQVSFLIFICTYMQNPYQSFYEISQKPHWIRHCGGFHVNLGLVNSLLNLLFLLQKPMFVLYTNIQDKFQNVMFCMC